MPSALIFALGGSTFGHLIKGETVSGLSIRNQKPMRWTLDQYLKPLKNRQCFDFSLSQFETFSMTKFDGPWTVAVVEARTFGQALKAASQWASKAESLKLKPHEFRIFDIRPILKGYFACAVFDQKIVANHPEVFQPSKDGISVILLNPAVLEASMNLGVGWTESDAPDICVIETGDIETGFLKASEAVDRGGRLIELQMPRTGDVALTALVAVPQALVEAAKLEIYSLGTRITVVGDLARYI